MPVADRMAFGTTVRYPLETRDSLGIDFIMERGALNDLILYRVRIALDTQCPALKGPFESSIRSFDPRILGRAYKGVPRS